jgi:5-formyltetrahydrofolate cyclo-ligase
MADLERIAQEKKRLRLEMLDRIDSLSKGQVEEYSDKINSRLLDLPEINQSQSIMFFLSIDNEVQTREGIEKLLISKEIYAPVSYKNKMMKAFRLENLSQVKLGAYNIPIPSGKEEIDKEMLDAIVLPGLAFDLKGNRVGRGFGYYDFFLRGTKAKRIALCYDFQVLPEWQYVTDRDQGVDVIVTEKDIYLKNL